MAAVADLAVVVVAMRELIFVVVVPVAAVVEL
jgi:hypothetical protein